MLARNLELNFFELDIVILKVVHIVLIAQPHEVVDFEDFLWSTRKLMAQTIWVPFLLGKGKRQVDHHSSILLGFSPCIILLKWLDLRCVFSCLTMKMKSNLRRIRNYLTILPVLQGFFTKYKSAWWSVKNKNLFASK